MADKVSGMIARPLRLNFPVLLGTALLALAVAAVVPVTASALTYEVDSTADEADADPGTGGCETAAGACTLRAAVEESNDSEVDDEVTFIAAFDGKTGDTITLTLGDLQVKEPVTINGGPASCDTTAGVKGPCVEVAGGGFDVESGGVTVRRLAITGAGTAIGVFNESEGIVVQGSWLGVKLNATASGNTVGIFIDPGSNEATIGGSTAADRNVIANSSNEGLDVEGASKTLIRGNYFGVAPDGTTQAANAKDVEITDSTAGGGFEAVENEVGQTATGEALTSAACDGGCNVISGATATGIDLTGSGLGEAPAAGPTVVHGNHVGLNAAGIGVVANGTFGILAGGADEATIGGAAIGDENFIAGGTIGIYGENGDNLSVLGNTVGFNAAGNPVTPPSNNGIFSFSLSISSLTANARLAGNTIRMTGGVPIEHRFTGAEIVQNEIEGGSRGILVFGETGALGNLIESNLVQGTEQQGILVQNDNNEVVDNEVFDSGLAGIRVENPAPGVIATGNVIGGDTPASENEIVGSGGDAIEIVEESGQPGSNHEVARNNGDLNGGLFIDLVGSANGGIKPPSFGTALEGGASGTAQPGARVRVFRKAGAAAGELQSFLVETIADGSGNWKVTYASSIPAGTIVAATQTSTAGGTSELTTATTTAPSEGGGATGGGGTVPPPPHDTKAPTTKITKGPKAKSTSTAAKFKFKADEPVSRFECKLDKGKFKKCKSPKTYKKLKPGKHVFKVRAIDKAGNIGKPAKRKFTILG
jgi:CSLREA domain-containing protein